MKKILLLLAVCVAATSCQWWHETFDSPEECAKWYIEEMVEADNLSDFEEVYNDFTKWENTLGDVDRWKVNKVVNDWSEDNEKKAEKIDEKYNDIYEKYMDRD